jgi:hypothetical protein
MKYKKKACCFRICRGFSRYFSLYLRYNSRQFLIHSKDMYWRYNETTRQMDPGYPHNISRWRGVPSDLDAAMTWTDGFTYFFKGRLFWRFDNIMIKTDDHYPLPAPQHWVGCPEKPDTIWW